MKRLHVKITSAVEHQIGEQVLFIARDSIDKALAWESRLWRYIDAIGDAYGHAIDENATERLGYIVRRAVFEDSYLLHYAVDTTSKYVRIVNFRHTSRLPRQNEP